MKAKNYFTTILITLSLTLTIILTAQEFTFEDEKTIDDIPFDTESIVRQVKADNGLISVQFEDEELINDIPFDTKRIVANYKYREALRVDFNFPEESTIDDIPFDTKSIVKHLKRQQSCCPFFVAFSNKHLL